jgi:rRNA maturation endonuclease Nob1
MICSICGNQATDAHHLYSQSKQARKLYGKLIDDEKNIMYLCNGCHLNRSIPKHSEREFCEIMGIEIRSKSGINKMRFQ